MQFINDNFGKLWLINSNPYTKSPVNGYTKYNLGDWNGKKGKQYIKDILPDFKTDYDASISYGIKHGNHPNGSITIGIDFDIFGKSGDEITYHPKTKKLFNDFMNITCAGVWSSGTDGNYGCLCIVESHKIISEIEALQQEKIEVDDIELIFETHHVLPPSKSKCKRSGVLRERKYFMENEPVCYVNDGDEVEAFVIKLIDEYKQQQKQNVKAVKSKTKSVKAVNSKTKDVKAVNSKTKNVKAVKQNPASKSPIVNISDEDKELADIIDLKYIDNYNDWTKLIWACAVEDNFELAHYISSRGKKYDGSETATRVIYDSFTDSRKGFSKATFYHYAKISNEKQYLETRAKYHKQFDDEDIEVVMNTLKLLNMKYENDDEELKKEMEFYDKLNNEEKKKLDKRKKEADKQNKLEELKLKQAYFEKFHFKVMSPPCYGRLAYDKTSLVSQSELNLMYENVLVGDDKFTDYWRKSKYIRTYENVDFLPQPCICPSYTFNTFTGLKASKLPMIEEQQNIDILLNHMRILTGKEEKGYKYLLNYMAHVVQRPGELPRTSLVFRSKQGVGKNIFFENFGTHIIGNENVLQTAEMDKVIGRFSMINNKLLVILDEASGKDSFSNSDKIKNIITAETIAWERKGIDGVKINNCGRYLIFSNNSTPVKIEMSDRRFVVYECANDVRNNREYFKNLMKAFNDEKVMRAFYDYLMDVDISEWDSINDRPITKAYKNIQSANIPTIARFLEYFVENCKNTNNTTDSLYNGNKIKSCDMYKLFKMWCDENKMKVEYTTTKFGRELNDYDGIEKAKFGKGVRGYKLDIDKIETYLVDNDYIEDCIEVDECFDDSDECDTDDGEY
jgi:hypothetical protein